MKYVTHTGIPGDPAARMFATYPAWEVGETRALRDEEAAALVRSFNRAHDGGYDLFTVADTDPSTPSSAKAPKEKK